MYQMHNFVIQYKKKVVILMKKIIPVLAVLGGVAAFAVYKMKKDEQKEIIDLDQGLMSDDDLNDEPVEEGPISDPQSCCMEDTKEALKDAAEDVLDTAEEACENAEDFVKDAVKKTKEVIGEFDEEFTNVLLEEAHDVKEKAKAMMNKMLEEGDVHEHERPVQHKVVFQSQADLNSFKNTVINKGFVVTKGDSDLELVVLHITPLDEHKLISNILYLVNEANSNSGKYEGWTSKTVY